LVVAFVVAHRGQYRDAFAILLVPALITLALVLTARFVYPRPEELAMAAPNLHGSGLSSTFWIYLAASALVAAGFADFQLIAFHFQKTEFIRTDWIPVLYAIAMAVSGAGSLVFGRLFDRIGIGVLVAVTLVTSAFAPLVFLGGFWMAVAGSALWGLGMGVHESIMPAAVAHLVGKERRASAYGIFTGLYGVAWFLGSAVMGVLYERSLIAVVVFCVAVQLVAVVPLLVIRKSMAQAVR
jgi:predicted MFS family arabinose efflux permease